MLTTSHPDTARTPTPPLCPQGRLRSGYLLPRHHHTLNRPAGRFRASHPSHGRRRSAAVRAAGGRVAGQPHLGQHGVAPAACGACVRQQQIVAAGLDGSSRDAGGSSSISGVPQLRASDSRHVAATAPATTADAQCSSEFRFGERSGVTNRKHNLLLILTQRVYSSLAICVTAFFLCTGPLLCLALGRACEPRMRCGSSSRAEAGMQGRGMVGCRGTATIYHPFTAPSADAQPPAICCQVRRGPCLLYVLDEAAQAPTQCQTA